ncbi:hypothetical protein B296_00026391 [Ensete ventricosum]|uniref:Uncharacterized protein n=1 Tax=Ensete ventricosum TaxID=4639 RepID=A0A427ARN6_ENSVE|nr:hypothetical protein B296_00026391 [Ensete ventricosum]
MELGVPYDDVDNCVVVRHAPLSVTTVMSRRLARPNVKLFDAVAAEDNVAEDNIVRLIREVVPGMIVTGMEITEIDRARRWDMKDSAVFFSSVSIPGGGGGQPAHSHGEIETSITYEDDTKKLTRRRRRTGLVSDCTTATAAVGRLLSCTAHPPRPSPRVPFLDVRPSRWAHLRGVVSLGNFLRWRVKDDVDLRSLRSMRTKGTTHLRMTTRRIAFLRHRPPLILFLIDSSPPPLPS